MRTDLLCYCLLVCLLPCVHPKPLIPNKEVIKEKFKQFLRKVIYGITPTTIYTTLRPLKFPEEYDPIKILDWQLREEKRKGITTPDFEPKLTDITNLWDGYFNDPTFDDVTMWCMRHWHANDSAPTTVMRYWEPGFGHEKSIEAIAKHWKEQALKENEEWWREAIKHSTKYVPLEDMTYDSVNKVKFRTYFDDAWVGSEDRRLVSQAQREADEEWDREEAPYTYNPDSPEKTTPPRPKEFQTSSRPPVTERRAETTEGNAESTYPTPYDPYANLKSDEEPTYPPDLA
ncbi:uncharacterized protein LOC103505876 [Diaphorina citri]|uniref:Uncharacterized protein LOC103505876 n=1 Tax=Diaphorina citri TaxID=121845 RepID=A0A1S4E7C4_DIACI|nr:uncharacterized protein LOC103505876 [Diaphorina citri]KAI5737899.1 hypothetical protein M8J77_000521 [Diaphorina citri]